MYSNNDPDQDLKNGSVPPRSAMVPTASASNDPNAVTPSQGWLQHQAAMQQAASQQAQQQGGPNPTPTGTNIPGITPTASMPTMSQMAQDKPNGWTPPPGYMNGSTNQQLQNSLPSNPANMSGMGQKGYAEGMLAGQQMLNAKDANSRANETQSWARQAVTKQQQIDQGMQQAAAKGGYGAVVDYLNTADPDRSLKIQDAKTQLDTSMLKANALSMQNDIEKKASLFAGYGLLGKMGATILAAPDNERQALYQQMMPMVKTINPDAPANVADAKSMFMLGAGQSMPDSALWAAKQDKETTAGNVETASNRMTDLIQKGVGASDPQMKAAVLDYQQAKNKDMLTQATTDEIQHKQAADDTQQQKDAISVNGSRMKNLNSFQDNYDKQSKDFLTFKQTMNNFNTAKNALQQNPQDPNAIQQMSAAMISLDGIKRNNPQMMNYFIQTDSKAGDFFNKIESTMNSNDQTYLASPEAIGRMNNLGTATFKTLSDQQNQVNSLYKPQAEQYLKGGQGKTSYDDSKNINWHEPPSPSNPNTSLSKNDIDGWAQIQIQKGTDPAQVNAYVQQQYKANGIK